RRRVVPLVENTDLDLVPEFGLEIKEVEGGRQVTLRLSKGEVMLGEILIYKYDRYMQGFQRSELRKRVNNVHEELCWEVHEQHETLTEESVICKCLLGEFLRVGNRRVSPIPIQYVRPDLYIPTLQLYGVPVHIGKCVAVVCRPPGAYDQCPVPFDLPSDSPRYLPTDRSSLFFVTVIVFVYFFLNTYRHHYQYRPPTITLRLKPDRLYSPLLPPIQYNQRHIFMVGDREIPNCFEHHVRTELLTLPFSFNPEIVRQSIASLTGDLLQLVQGDEYYQQSLCWIMKKEIQRTIMKELIIERQKHCKNM
ncbi:Uncharacterized protein FWK35_00035941, partial [Aphis craccivora]